MQLNKYLAHAGLCSRRKAADLIAYGHIRVNDTIITHPGYRVQDDDRVYYGHTRVQTERPVYVLFNKPKGCTSTVSDERGRATVLDYIHHEPPLPRIYPVGRLDYNSTGLLVVTNDGALAQKLLHPAYEVPKRYHVRLHKPLTNDDIERIKTGIWIDREQVPVDDVQVSPYCDRDVRIELHSGKKRVIRRIFDALGYRVEKLDRPWYAGIAKRGLARGDWRFLSDREVVQLQRYTNKGT